MDLVDYDNVADDEGETVDVVNCHKMGETVYDSIAAASAVAHSVENGVVYPA